MVEDNQIELEYVMMTVENVEELLPIYCDTLHCIVLVNL